VPWLTPETLPEGTDCRPLLIPASSEWLAIVSGALTELTQKWNWEQFGSVTVNEAIEAMQSMIDNYYGGCQPCTQPGGFRVLRLSEDGHVEELAEDGTYVPATGDYAVPPIPAREGGSPTDQICLAAANADNVLHGIYQNLADSFASNLSEAEALTALVEFLIVTLGAEFAPITYGLALLLLAVFGVVYSALAFVTADLWDDNFTKAFKCMLVECATNSDGVVTFDWKCISDKLYAGSLAFGINERQLRLWGQISYILNFIGGADALNTAGATTGITEADCAECSGDFYVITTPGQEWANPANRIGFIGVEYQWAAVQGPSYSYERIVGLLFNVPVNVDIISVGARVPLAGTDLSYATAPDALTDYTVVTVAENPDVPGSFAAIQQLIIDASVDWVLTLKVTGLA